MATNEKLKILIVDDHDIVRKGLAMLVSRQEDLFVVAEAGTVVEAVKKARESVPDVVEWIFVYQTVPESMPAATSATRTPTSKF